MIDIKAIKQAAIDSDETGFASVLTNNDTVIALCDEIERLRAIEESRDKAWAVAKSLQAQVSILLPVVEVAADDDDEYGIGPKARKALEALAAHKET